ncbi:MAG: 4Fe-4S cluster-binding domain-containing protein, partial [Candidatus Aegiribacteria sp.]|nr:4Fe-4S cluster-binding domain-containing protein [Candidatus Aegiribacteria sp.]MBD3294477.1 4Fe-4S cluster-binding domain-containing protein [Candidatus Fermentibacteria bacterium]
MKLSRYNWLVEHENDVVAYNGFTGAMARLKPENVPAVRKLFDSEKSIDHLLKGMPEDLREGLSHGGYVIDDELDERKLLRLAFNARKFSHQNDFMGFTLVMTRRCNFRCPYCYEQDTLGINDSISNEVIDRVIKLAGESSAKVFSVTLYGGEPLLES